MQAFISESIDDILRYNSTLENVVIVLPSQRAKVFVRNVLKQKIRIGFLPRLLNIEEWISEVSQIQRVESSLLLFEFYKVYKSIEKHPEPFQSFIDWAPTVLNDFNEIDQYLVETKRIFDYVRDIERLQKWSVTGTFQETDLIKSHRYFLEKLNPLYDQLYQNLKFKNRGYQGLLYREAVSNLENYLESNAKINFYFIGFNALNKAEEVLMKRVVTHNSSDIYWDIDSVFLEENHQVASFISKYKSTWEYYEDNEFKSVGNNFSKLEDIQVIGASKQVSQIKYVSELLAQNDAKNTALILGDESVLPVVLNSIPKNINGVNITMGYQLKDLPITNFFSLLIQLHSDQKSTAYFKDIFKIINHPFLRDKYAEDFKALVDQFVADVELKNRTFIQWEAILQFFCQGDVDFVSVFKAIFSLYESPSTFISRFKRIIELLKDQSNSIERESLFRLYTIFNQLLELEENYGYLEDPKTLGYLFDRFLGKESLYFQGEPLMGLQIMGLLETRALDFENLIITGVNEGVLPKDSKSNSFIPFDVKMAFGLPTYREKDAIFAYHFFRLISHAKKVTLLYNSITDDFGQGEPSRFLKQLELLKPKVPKLMVAPKVNSQKILPKEIEVIPEVQERIAKLFKSGLSPTAITTYLYNPLSFYKKYVLKIYEAEEVEETIAANTLGNVIHYSLKSLYDPFVGKFVSASDVRQMIEKSDDEVTKWINIEIKEGNIQTGKNRLIYEVAKKYVQNFLKSEEELLADDNNALKIISLEEDYQTQIYIPELNETVQIKGQIDRIDELNDEVRIIDYKTGKVDQSNLNIGSLENLRHENHHKAIQLLIYAILATKSGKIDGQKPLVAGNISFKNLKSGLLLLNFSEPRKKHINEITKERLEAFQEILKDIIKDLANEKSFVENLEAKY
jgi:hypothetical protein